MCIQWQIRGWVGGRGPLGQCPWCNTYFFSKNEVDTELSCVNWRPEEALLSLLNLFQGSQSAG